MAQRTPPQHHSAVDQGECVPERQQDSRGLVSPRARFPPITQGRAAPRRRPSDGLTSDNLREATVGIAEILARQYWSARSCNETIAA